jgi:hypothetical protein
MDRSDESSCKQYSTSKNEVSLIECNVAKENTYKEIVDFGELETRKEIAGFECGPNICLPSSLWCQKSPDQGWVDEHLLSVCPSVIGSLQNSFLCQNLTFWGNKKCPKSEVLYIHERCRGNWPSQCFSYYAGAKNGDGDGIDNEYCGYELTYATFLQSPCSDKSRGCKMFDGRAKCIGDSVEACRDNSYCLAEDSVCDGYVQCKDGSDEDPDRCKVCPRTFGFPIGKVRRATFSCRHRYTGRWICAVPCDGVDDLCQNFEDEDCKGSPFITTLFIATLLLLVTILWTEPIFRKHYKKIEGKNNWFEIECHLDKSFRIIENIRQTLCLKKLQQLKREMTENHSNDNKGHLYSTVDYMVCGHSDLKKQLSNTIHQIELKCHRGNLQEILACIKTNIGTNDRAQILLSSFQKKAQSRIRKMVALCYLKMYASLGRFFGICFRLVTKAKQTLMNSFPQKFQTQISQISDSYLSIHRRKGRLFLIYLKHAAKALFKILMYYLDLIKDIIFIAIPANVLVSSLTSFNSFGSQIFFLMWTSILLPGFVNFVFVLAKNPLKSFQSIFFRFGFAMLSPLAPGIAILMSTRYNIQKDICFLKYSKNPDSQEVISIHKNIAKFETEIEFWNKITSSMKLIEITFENLIQATVLIVVVLLKYSQTTTVTGLQELFAGGDLSFLVISAIWSVISIVLAPTNSAVTSKNGFMPFLGKIILAFTNLLSISTRLFAIILYFAPALGLLNLLQHFRFGNLPVTPTPKLYDVTHNGTILKFSDAWLPIKSYEELTFFNLNVYYSAFLILIAIHYINVTIIKYRFSINFGKRKQLTDKIFHVLTQLHSPSNYTDWDETEDSTYEENWKKVKKEMKSLILLFTVEHILMCIPLWILSYSISVRNQYLAQYFPMLEEEKNATELGYTLSVLCPLVFAAFGYFQFQLFLIYHKHAHPWSEILFPKETKENRKKKPTSKANDVEQSFKLFWRHIEK